MNETGRNNRVVISAIFFETEKVLKPIEFYGAMRIHLITHNTNDDGEPKRINEEFCNYVKEKCEKFPFIEENGITIHDISLTKLEPLLGKILNIIEGERKNNPTCDIYVI